MQFVLNGLYQVTDVGISSLAANCTTLTHLFMHGLNRVSDDAMVALSTSCWRMELLEFSPNVQALSSPVPTAKVGDRGIIALGSTMKKLRSLHAAGLRRITDAGIMAIAAGCPGTPLARSLCQEVLAS